jgi:hypothetical protein
MKINGTGTAGPPQPAASNDRTAPPVQAPPPAERRCRQGRPWPACYPVSGGLPPAEASANAVCWHRGAMQRYEYQVQQLRESMIGGKLSSDKLERLLNDEAGKGWRLKAITSADVKGRVGPGGVEGLIITFERPVG